MSYFAHWYQLFDVRLDGAQRNVAEKFSTLYPSPEEFMNILFDYVYMDLFSKLNPVSGVEEDELSNLCKDFGNKIGLLFLTYIQNMLNDLFLLVQKIYQSLISVCSHLYFFESDLDSFDFLLYQSQLIPEIAKINEA